MVVVDYFIKAFAECERYCEETKSCCSILYVFNSTALCL